jgi:lipopolysaccharide transport system ATP-binding protein
MSDYIIKVENLGKKYKIRHQQERQRYVALRDVVSEKAAAPLRWLRQHGAWSIEHGANNGAPRSLLSAPSSKLGASGSLLPAPSSPLPTEEFWALRGVFFEVEQGEVLGIIGRNGAGKSTLLKILSRITEPTEGRVRIRGRVASLLEVGTGFHPELTGRENIFLNGAILGMTREEIRRKFDQIVDFSGVEKFIDTPVKRYSSGMYVRLAFAVAAHLEPEILIVDEVLAVGDTEFQKKCLGKMQEVSIGGRTVLFVSHNITMIRSLCSRGILLDHGAVKLLGSATKIVDTYLGYYTDLDSFERSINKSDKLKIVSGKIVYTFSKISGFRVAVELKVWSDSDRKVSLDLRISEGTGIPVGFGSLGTFASADLVEFRSGITMILISFPTDFLANGRYVLSLDVTIPFREYLDRAERCLSFELERTATIGENRAASQDWGYGSLEIPVSLEQLAQVNSTPN